MRGFTLIELSIVLVIIGLIVGGILVGQDLIKNAEVRAQISQIERYNQAVNTFRAKFNAIPGDMAVGTANQFGFTIGASCGGQAGGRDGNGLIDAWPYAQGNQLFGETSLFWQDLSSGPAGSLIDGAFPNSGAAAITCSAPGVAFSTTPGITYIGDYLPVGKIGHGTFITVYEYYGINWYALEAVTGTNTNGLIGGFGSGTIPVVQAYNIDRKIDDGLPTTGAVQTMFVGTTSNQAPTLGSNAATDTTTSCYNTTSNIYSLSSLANYGAGGNCALSFRFQ